MKNHRLTVLVTPLTVMSLFLPACSESPVLDSVQTRNAAWSVDLPAVIGEARAAQVVSDRVVVSAKGGVAVLGRQSGKVLWHQRRHGDRTKNNYDTFVTPDVVIMTEYAANDGEVRIFDIKSGKQRGAVSTAGGEVSVAVTSTAVATVSCGGVDDCMLTMMDASSARRMWQRPVSQGTQVSVASRQAPFERTWMRQDDPLLVPNGTTLLLRNSGWADSAKIISLSTGKRLGSLRMTGSDSRFISADVYLQWADRGGCVATVTGNDLSADGAAWTATLGRWAIQGGSAAKCRPHWTERVTGGALLAMTPRERPQVIDVRSGEATWSGEKGFYPVGYADDVLVLRSDRGRGDVIGVDLDREKEIWRLPAKELEFGPGLPLKTAVTGAGLTYTVSRLTDEGTTRLVLALHNLHTGEPRWIAAGSNQLLGIGDDWVVSRQPSGASNVVRLFDA